MPRNLALHSKRNLWEFERFFTILLLHQLSEALETNHTGYKSGPSFHVLSESSRMTDSAGWHGTTRASSAYSPQQNSSRWAETHSSVRPRPSSDLQQIMIAHHRTLFSEKGGPIDYEVWLVFSARGFCLIRWELLLPNDLSKMMNFLWLFVLSFLASDSSHSFGTPVLMKLRCSFSLLGVCLLIADFGDAAPCKLPHQSTHRTYIDVDLDIWATELTFCTFFFLSEVIYLSSNHWWSFLVDLLDFIFHYCSKIIE